MKLRQLHKRLRIRVLKYMGLHARRVEGIRLYGQGLDDMYLLRLLRRSDKGFYVDVGANDGIFVSNTYALYRLGWRGVCIDPNPSAYQLLVKNRPQDVCLNVAVGQQPGTVELAWRTDYTEMSAVGANFSGGETCKVQQRRLTDILNEVNAPVNFDLLTVDVEGMELEVLTGLDWEVYRPRLVLIEYNSAGNVTMDAFDYLQKFGYRPVLINRWNILLSTEWQSDILEVHKGQDWYKLDRPGF